MTTKRALLMLILKGCMAKVLTIDKSFLFLIFRNDKIMLMIKFFCKKENNDKNEFYCNLMNLKN